LYDSSSSNTTNCTSSMQSVGNWIVRSSEDPVSRVGYFEGTVLRIPDLSYFQYGQIFIKPVNTHQYP